MEIVILLGKSASGKDTLEKELTEKHGFVKMISSTDRPIREGETNGVEYNFRTKEEFSQMIKENRLVEHREYQTKVDGIPDIWRYGLEKCDLTKGDKFIAILTVEGAEVVRNTYKDKVHTFYLDVDDEERMHRCIQRGSYNKEEWERRLEADTEDFSEDKVKSVHAKCIPATLPVKECVNMVLNELEKERTAKNNRKQKIEELEL